MYLTIDEQLLPLKVTAPFFSILSKPDKYGLKIFLFCVAMSFCQLKAKTNLVQEENSPQQNIGQNVVLELLVTFNHLEEI